MECCCSPAAMTALPTHPALFDLPKGPGPLRSVVQGLVLHREWTADYGVEAGRLRVEEQNLRSAAEVVLVAPTSTSARPASFRPVIELEGQPTTVLVEQAGAVDVTRLGDLVGHLRPEDQWGIDTALSTVFDLR